MKILYALQGTGNGHIARANELIPKFKQVAEVDVFVSGNNTQLPLDGFYKQNKGLSLFYSKKGGLDYKKIVVKNSLTQFSRAILNFPIQEYDLIINDYEPITAYAAKWHGKKIIGLSHQAAIFYENVPKPPGKHPVSKLIFKKYAPTDISYGFHFQKYHDDIFYPILRQQIKQLQTVTGSYFLVYLPSFNDVVLQKILTQIPEVHWLIFSPFKKNPERYLNVSFYPIDQELFFKKLAAAQGVLCGAGFEFPAEVLHLKKMLYVIPIKGQFEQYCNYAALTKMGVSGSEDLNVSKIRNWIDSQKIITVDFEDESEKIIEKVFINNPL